MKMKQATQITALSSAIMILIAGCSSEKQATAKTPADFHETGLPIVDKPITLTIAGNFDDRTGAKWNELETFKKINEGTNVQINWNLTPGTDWKTKRNLIIASDDLPDVLLDLTTSQVVTGGAEGTFIPLEDMIEKYAPNLKNFLTKYPEVRQAITAPDGHIYSLPLANMSEYKHADGNTLWINKEWLKKIGMEMPKTTDDLLKVLKAFKEQDMDGDGNPNNEIPLTGVYGDGQYGFGNLFGSFNTLDRQFIVKDDKVQFVRGTEEFRNAIKYLHSLYELGLIDPDSFTQNSTQHIAKISAGKKASVGAFFAWSADQITNASFRWDYGSPMIPLVGPTGAQVTAYNNLQMTPGMFTITKVNKHPEATMRWVDRAYEPEMSMMLREGPNRLKKLDNGRYDIIENPPNFTAGEWKVKETPYNSFVYGFSEEMRKKQNLPKAEPGQLDPDFDEWYEALKPYMKHWIFPNIMFTDEQYKQIERYQTDIKKYTDKMEAQWIVKGGIDTEWDNYLKTLDKMGLKDFIKVYQEGYDTNKKNLAKK
ncbi:ABC transporter substrate-binding protein [Paenibacillus sp. J31TS4]|uniref:extracellular solute-binding protein n=1 Tax=Paenibacillus sp. J31TS4 TaxID=2807195 RepID=UPI001B12E1A6|nr:ABC transporter substrate-binding protein [Paenibacillus sp. J31TS4]